MKLPVELLYNIIEIAAHNSQNSSERRQILFNLCLVSKSIYSFAIRTLWSNLDFNTYNARFMEVINQGYGKNMRIKRMQAHLSDGEEFVINATPVLVEVLKNVESVNHLWLCAD